MQNNTVMLIKFISGKRSIAVEVPAICLPGNKSYPVIQSGSLYFKIVFYPVFNAGPDG
jgi:hypothetical protein